MMSWPIFSSSVISASSESGCREPWAELEVRLGGQGLPKAGRAGATGDGPEDQAEKGKAKRQGVNPVSKTIAQGDHDPI